MQLELSNLSWKNICKDKDSCLHSVLKKSVPEKIDKLSDEDILNIKMSMFAYTMHIYSYVQMQKVCKSYGLVAKDTNTILHAILENFEVSIGLKQATLIMLSNSQMNIKSNIGKILKSNSLNESNAAFLKSVQGISLPKGILKKIKEKPLLPASQIRKNCNNDIKDLRPYVAKFVRRKLSFIVQHNRYDHEDLISDLTRKGVETYYRVTPFVTPEHRVNSMKQSIHNQGMKLISFYTSKKRARIVQTENGDFAVKEHSLVDIEGNLNDRKLVDNDWQNPVLDFELNNFVEKYNKEYPKRALIVNKLLCDETDIQFTSFVRKRLRVSSYTTMETINSSRPGIYRQLIAEHHDIPELTVRRIAYELLRDYNGLT